MIRVLILLLICVSIKSQGQEVERMEILAEGINGFLVKEFPNKTEVEIFKSVKDWTEYNIHNADFATNSQVENEFISFKVNQVGVVNFKNKSAWNLNLYVEIRIKPEKLRIDIELLEIDGILENTNSLLVQGRDVILGLYKKNGDAVKGYESTREDINRVLNEFCLRIFESVEGKKDYKKEDW
jgi:hypothetical protein